MICIIFKIDYQIIKLSITAWVNSVVLAFPPKSPVRYFLYLITLKTEFSIDEAYLLRPILFNIIVPDSNKAVGLALFWPAISGAVPWTA